MGAFIIFDIEFERKNDRTKFETLYKIKKKDILLEEGSPGGFAYLMFRNPFLNPIYYMGFLGYGEPKEVLRECLKKGIKIKFLAWIPINDKNSSWEKIRGRW